MPKVVMLAAWGSSGDFLQLIRFPYIIIKLRAS
jgi:hypothetical protein